METARATTWNSEFPMMLSRMASPQLPFPSTGIILLLQTISPWLSWSTQDTHGDCLKSEQFHNQCLCLHPHLRTQKKLKALQMFRTVIVSLDFLISLTTTMRHTCQISSWLNASKDACSSVLSSMCRNRKEATTLHLAHGHLNNRTLLLDLEAACLPYKDLKRCILAISCEAWSCTCASQTFICWRGLAPARHNISEYILFCETSYLHFTTCVFNHSTISPFLGGAASVGPKIWTLWKWSGLDWCHPVRTPTNKFVCLFVCLFVCFFVCLFVCLFVFFLLKTPKNPCIPNLRVVDF